MANDDSNSSNNNASKDAVNSPGMTLQGAPKLALKSDEMRKIVLDYLTHSAYVDTAIAFARDSSGSTQASGSGSSSRAHGLAASAAANGDDMDEDAEMQDQDNDDFQDGDADTTIRESEHNGSSSGSSHSSDNDIDTPMLKREDVRLIRIRRGKLIIFV